MQLVTARKAHPADEPGKATIQQWAEFVSRPEVRQHAVFIADRDPIVAQHLVQT